MSTEKLQDGRIGDMKKMFSIYQKYTHNVDISLGEEQGDPDCIRNYKVKEISVASVRQQTTQDTELETPVVDPRAGGHDNNNSSQIGLCYGTLLLVNYGIDHSCLVSFYVL